jgi:GAF domain-containing protein/nitrogen-specific signal transduction histidine kinase
MSAMHEEVAADPRQLVAQLRRERDEALLREAAMAEVLQIINSSPGNLAPVFDAMLEKALRLCGAAFGVLWTYDGGSFHAAALRNVPTPYAEFLTRGPYQPEPEGAHGRIVNGESLIHIVDVADTELYRSGGPLRRALVDLGGARSAIAVALRRDNTLLGFFVIYRQEVRPFSDKQIWLLQNFAAQAVIAMENARLLTETREALDQQTATAEVLQVINSSPGDLAPVFDATLEKAMLLCGAAFGVLWTYEGDRYRAAAVHGAPVEFVEFLRQPLQPHYDSGSGLERALRGENLVINDDMASEEIYRHGDPLRRAIVDLGGARSHVLVALRKDETLLGAITIYRQEVRQFTDKQIALLQNFAAQAVIAMENARLITETREALEQQTATAEVLQVINSSPGALVPVFDAMLERAMRLCEAAFGFMMIYDGDRFRPGAQRGVPRPLAEYFAAGPDRPGPGEAHTRVLAGEKLIHSLDYRDEEPYRHGAPLRRAVVDLGGARTALVIALRKDNLLLGTFTLYRQEVRPFTDKQIALLQNFATQAVIAMENARLITQTREALEQQTATAEVLQVINSSPGDLPPIFDAMLEKALHLCEASFGSVYARNGERFERVASRGLPAEYLAAVLSVAGPFSAGSLWERIISGENLISIPDLSDPEVIRLTPRFEPLVRIAGARSYSAVALRKDEQLLGLIVVYRREVRPFSDKQIELLQNFAAQAVIAMENARLLTETREALEQQTATAEVLQVINSSPGDLAPVFDAMLEKALRLGEAAFGTLATYDGEFFRFVAAHGEARLVEAEQARGLLPPSSGVTWPRLLHGESVVHVADVMDTDLYRTGHEGARWFVDIGGGRALLTIALLKEDALLGALTVFRQEVRPFSDKQIALLQNFAAQAVIAMENARLITETREALEQQTATTAVLQVINGSPGDLAPVFDAILEKAHTLCEAAHGGLVIRDGEGFRVAAARGESRFTEAWRQAGTIRPPPGSPVARLIDGEDFVHIADVRTDDFYRNAPPYIRSLVETGGVRSTLLIPLRKDGALLGFITAYRREVWPFADKQIALLQNFATQAVIAMENARLLTETREALEQQTATTEVLQVINSSPGDLAPVFEAMLEKAMRLCEAGFGELDVYDGQNFRVAANEYRRTNSREKRLFRSARDTAERALQELQAAQTSLVHAQKMAALGQLTAGIAHEIKNPLNFVNNFAELSGELLLELKETTAPAVAALGDDERAAVDEVVEMLRGNLDKIAEHGKRADGIVKSMLEHSRGVSGERRVVDLNALIEEALNLAYHGARAQDASFNISLEREFDRGLAPTELAPQEMTRVFLNLFGNGFYATAKRQRDGAGTDFRPILKVATRDLGDAVEVRVRDNGTGIAPEIRDKLFQPFVTTKPTGEGTGLGLSIAYDIVTQQHGGVIEVDSREGEFTEFTIRLPRARQVTTAAAEAAG